MVLLFSAATVLGIVLVVVGLGLLLHHGWHHSFDEVDSPARLESCQAACFFQIPDITNHETWIVVCFTNALSIAVIGPLLAPIA